MADNRQNFSASSSRQKVIAVILLIVFAIIFWQIFKLFRSRTSAPLTVPNKTAVVDVQTVTPRQLITQTPPVAKPAPLSPREVEMQRMQQEVQARYVTALNELQMLRLNQSIAEANRAIMNAKLATVTAEKGIVDLLAPPAQVTTNTYAQGLVNPTNGASPNAPAPVITAEVKYSVISVSQLQAKWSAVMGYGGNLYHVSIGDILSPDGSVIISINKNGVTLQKDGKRRRISLVPII